MNRLDNLTENLTTIYSTSKYTPRRKAEEYKLNKDELINEIHLEIKFLELSGEPYWNYSKVLAGLYKRIGFPRKQDKQANDLFGATLTYVSNKYIPTLSKRLNYTFQIKEKVDSVEKKRYRNMINFYITLLEKEGKQFFSKACVRECLNIESNWPVPSDRHSVELFTNLFYQEASKYQPSLRERNCYSFQLKPAPNHTVQTKILKQ